MQFCARRVKKLAKEGEDACANINFKRKCPFSCNNCGARRDLLQNRVVSLSYLLYLLFIGSQLIYTMFCSV